MKANARSPVKPRYVLVLDQDGEPWTLILRVHGKTDTEALIKARTWFRTWILEEEIAQDQEDADEIMDLTVFKLMPADVRVKHVDGYHFHQQKR